MAERLQIPESCPTLARHTTREATLGKPGELRSSSLVAESCPNCRTVGKKPTIGPNSTNICRFGPLLGRHGPNLAKPRPPLTKSGRCGLDVGAVWPNQANFWPVVAKLPFGQIWPHCANIWATSTRLVKISRMCANCGPNRLNHGRVRHISVEFGPVLPSCATFRQLADNCLEVVGPLLSSPGAPGVAFRDVRRKFVRYLAGDCSLCAITGLSGDSVIILARGGGR